MVSKPDPLHLTRKEEHIGFSAKLVRLYFWVITFGKYRIYYLLDNDRVVHTSYLVPKCSKFPFMGKNDLEIGPCFTEEQYRRKGGYAYMLERITTSAEYENAHFYMIVRDTNLPSVKGIEKSGFERCGTIVRTKLLKRYIKVS